ncbi:hypothetical protein MRS76_23515 [Rhizobiaceae bacterium n13]|uniref:Uncharacterized protein n=1 Tax=Ferirhizobium litorale TaxID=2927786 RepID=A0AAE3QJF9_9HYPH|nr:hypothetical protein [Fererhizobium litorale]MDI7864900.1 hypothetical protein [Fererhizobium litorale]MDI7925020.1 hypothetical protein [Fererhizobium litorale]
MHVTIAARTYAASDAAAVAPGRETGDRDFAGRPRGLASSYNRSDFRMP